MKQHKHDRPILVLLLATLLIHLSLFLIIPILPILFQSEYHYNPQRISIILGTNALAIQVGSLISVFISDRFGRKLTMVLGAMLLGISFFSYTLITQYYLFILVALGSGIGHGMNAPVIKAAIKGCVEDSKSTMAFSWRGIAANLGVLISGILIYVLHKNPSNFLFYISSAIVIVLALFLFFFLPKEEKTQKPDLHLKDYSTILKNQSFMFFTLTMLFMSFAYAQLIFLLPMKAEKTLENDSLVGIIWMCISLEVVLLQFPVGKYLLCKSKPLSAFIWALIAFAGGVLIIGFASAFPLLLLSALVFTIGQTLLAPTGDRLTGEFAEGNLLGAYYSVANLVGGLGSALGTYSSGFILKRLAYAHSLFPWVIISGILFSFIFIIRLFFKHIPQNNKT